MDESDSEVLQKIDYSMFSLPNSRSRRQNMEVSCAIEFYGTSGKTQLMERDVQTSETVSYCI